MFIFSGYQQSLIDHKKKKNELDQLLLYLTVITVLRFVNDSCISDKLGPVLNRRNSLPVVSPNSEKPDNGGDMGTYSHNTGTRSTSAIPCSDLRLGKLDPEQILSGRNMTTL